MSTFSANSARVLGRSPMKSILGLIRLITLFLIFSSSYVFAEDSVPRDRAQYLRAQMLKNFFAPELTAEESELVLPDKPQYKDFTEYVITGTSKSKFFADVSSITVGEDRIIRLALATRSPSGAWSLTYEGFDCEKYEYRIYGTSRGFDNEWRKNKRSKWTHAKTSNALSMRFDLARYYLCYGEVNVRLSEISERLEKGLLTLPGTRR